MLKLLSLLFAIALPAIYGQGTPTFKADVVSKTVNAINYNVLGGTTKIKFVPTTLLPLANGEAEVKSLQNVSEIKAKFEKLDSPTKFGAEYLTYVLWAISPEGSTRNLGEILVDKNGKAEMQVTTQMQVFALVVTAEPYFAVRVPTDLIVLQNEIQKKVKGRVFTVDAKTELLKKGEYAKLSNPLGMAPDLKAQPLEMYEARNAIHIAESFKADKYADDTLKRAKASLQMADNALAKKADRKQVATFARESVQFAEESRQLSITRQNQEADAATKAKSEENARLRAEAEAQSRAAEAQSRAAEEARKAEEARRAKAEVEAARAAQARAEAEAANLKAQAAQQASAREAASATSAAEAARLSAQKAEQEKQELRRRLLNQFNSILETKDTERGLVVNIGDVLFAVGKADLSNEAKLKLARFAGIVLNYPELNVAAEGHTDNTGSDAINQKLSEDRAAAVQQFLASQGIPANRITAVGHGKSMPVESNDTAAGRSKNRRVEMTVSGDVIGQKIG